MRAFDDTLAALAEEYGHAGRVTLPSRKRLNHRGPLSIDVSSAWYFITLCAAERFDYGRAVSMKPPSTPFIEHANDILDSARFRHERFAWRLALFLIMPDHIHLIAHFPATACDAAVSSKPPYHGGMQRVIADLKRWLSTKYGIRFQRDFFDTRLRDDAHFAEKYEYILGNPVRKGLCATPSDWPYSIAFSRNEVGSRVPRDRDDVSLGGGCDDGHVGRVPLPACNLPDQCNVVGSRVPRDRIVRPAVATKRQTNLEPSEKQW